jgi:hypothetical protein
VKCLVITPGGGRVSLRAAVCDVGARRTGGGLEQKNEGEKKRHREP